jgi:DNA-binding response OmpR family regulator
LNRIKILLIEGTHSQKETSFALDLSRYYDIIIATSGKQALSLAEMVSPDLVVLNSASMRTSGERICSALRQRVGDIPIIHIRKAGAAPSPDDQEADIVLEMPFTARKLLNRIQHFSNSHDGEVLQVATFHLNLKNHLLTTRKGEKRLTPKTSALLEIFMRHPDQVLKRDYLMQQIWETDYMGDTRTLDVHIRWLREAIEPVPGKPVHLVTVRGLGYKLIVRPKKIEKR